MKAAGGAVALAWAFIVLPGVPILNGTDRVVLYDGLRL